MPLHIANPATEDDLSPASGLPVLSAGQLAGSTSYLGSDLAICPQNTPLPPYKILENEASKSNIINGAFENEANFGRSEALIASTTHIESACA